jgi:signal transduction histidine kinase
MGKTMFFRGLGMDNFVMMQSGSNKEISVWGYRLFAWLGCLGLCFGIGSPAAGYGNELPANQLSQILTNISQFRGVFNENADITCRFRVAGTVTMVDTNRNLFVLQDDTGAIAISLNEEQIAFQAGQLIAIQGTEASPYFESFPSYPYQPSGWDVRNSFEAPSNWGEYHLTRMRGYLHPKYTGDYTFWIASDNSSELWLSSDDRPAKARKIAFIKSGDWVNQHEWLRYPSQRSETINLSADKIYYIEAVAEQLLLDEHLAVAWQPPGSSQSIIDGQYLTPWVEDQAHAFLSQTNGVLREYWTNFTLGNLAGIVGQKPFTSMFVLKGAQATVIGPGVWPESQQIFLDQRLPPENNFHWVKLQGTINFIGIDGNSAILEIACNGRQAQVRVADWKVKFGQRFQNRRVQVEGVCEGMQTDNGYLMPGLIWTPSNEYISIIESTNSNDYSDAAASLNHPTEESIDTNHIWTGYVSLRGVVTFNDQVFGRNFLFIQNNAAGVYISQINHRFNQLQVGQWVEVGGAMIPDGSTPSFEPVVVTILGTRPIPQLITQPVEIPVPASRNGQWTELEGVVHSINTNGTMVMAGKNGSVPVWIGRTSQDALKRYVDSALRVRGVLSVTMESDPILLVPSRSFVEVEDEAPVDPFKILPRNTKDINNVAVDNKWIHRVKIEGVVTYQNGQSLFVQDAYGGVEVELPNNNSLVNVGDKVEVVGFPNIRNLGKILTEALVRVVASNESLNPRKLSLTTTNLSDCYGTLVALEAVVLTQKIKDDCQILDLQEGQHLFEAILLTNFGRLPNFESGSRLGITGVLEQTGLVSEKSTKEGDLSESVTIFLRGPQDVKLLGGAPWWTWKGFILLAGILLTVITTGLLVIYILRRRLERQRVAKFIFSRQILQSQEEERRRIAVNLHDTLGQNLLIIKNQSHLAMQLPVDESVIRRRLSQISEVTALAIEEVRQITRNLRPYQLDRLGLTHAIRAIIKQMSENGPILFASHVDEIDGTFDKESEIHVYRIIQESINNIIKHSGATEATIVIKKNTTIVSLSIRDNGRGFDVTLNRPVGFGLNNIIERTWILGGESKIDTSPGHGTNLIFEIPIPSSRNEK